MSYSFHSSFFISYLFFFVADREKNLSAIRVSILTCTIITISAQQNSQSFLYAKAVTTHVIILKCYRGDDISATYDNGALQIQVAECKTRTYICSVDTRIGL